MKFSYDVDPMTITIRLVSDTPSLWSRLTGKSSPADLDHLPHDQQQVLFALADLRAIGDEMPGNVKLGTDRIVLSHDAVAALSDSAAVAIGLPASVHLTLNTDVEGLIGQPNFRLEYHWTRDGRREMPRRVGAILKTADGDRRIPLWMKRAIDIADNFEGGPEITDHWAALARFRQAIEPDDAVPEASKSAHLAMTAFLRGLNVRIANQFSIAPDDDLSNFDVIPFSSDRIERDSVDPEDISESDAELNGDPLANFQYALRSKGARAAYSVGDRSYLVIDAAAMPVLAEMARAQHLPREERRAFVQNPRARITAAVSVALRESGKLSDLSDAEQEELIEKTAGPAFIETRQYSERVTGVIVWQKPAIEPTGGGGTTWLPEVFAQAIVSVIQDMDTHALEELLDKMKAALASDNPNVTIAGEQVEVTPQTLGAVEAELNAKTNANVELQSDVEADERPSGPIILETQENLDALNWTARITPRVPSVPVTLPKVIMTPMKQHQLAGFNWAFAAWQAGLPGILNADEQGLGKTLQTIAFLAWLQSHASRPDAARRGPILVVAPTSLLVNWEQEVDRHVTVGGFGHLVRLYGTSLGAQLSRNSRGRETESGTARMDMPWLNEAIGEGRAHRYWFLTTYTTLTNYQHSLATIPFSTIVYDEIQALKNPVSLRSMAGAAMQADFRIGLTGTPIENSTTDLWAILEQLSPGTLGSLREFRQRYLTPDEGNMVELYNRVFGQQNGLPALAIRRLKDQVARDLPFKERRLHPRAMPPSQAKEYDAARDKLARRDRGAALKMLHHIRSVSVHPFTGSTNDDTSFIEASARLSVTMDILRRIRTSGERALVFIEHRAMQYRFAELAKREFGLSRVDIINGETPIQRRQQIVNRFQEHLNHDGGFDLLVLGPKAAGTGLTLTAATHVIHLSRWWNPAVEEQCNDRVHRIGQTRPVTVHVPIAIHEGYREGSFDCLLHSLMQRKRRLASSALWPMGDTDADAAGLQDMLSAAVSGGGGNPVDAALAAMFQRDDIALPAKQPDGSLVIS